MTTADDADHALAIPTSSTVLLLMRCCQPPPLLLLLLPLPTMRWPPLLTLLRRPLLLCASNHCTLFKSRFCMLSEGGRL